MLSERTFAKALKDFEASLEQSLDTLLAMKSGHPSTQLATFQPLLYNALLKLSRAYHQIRKERERLIIQIESITVWMYAWRC